MDACIKAEHDYSTDITDNDSFMRRYSMLSRDICELADKTFGCMKTFKPKLNNITNKKIRGILSSLHVIGSAIRLEKSGGNIHTLLKAMYVHEHTYVEYLGTEGQQEADASFLTHLQRRHHLLYKELYRQCTLEIVLQANQEDRRHITDAPKGGSTHRLFVTPYVPLLMVVNSLDDP